MIQVFLGCEDVALKIVEQIEEQKLPFEQFFAGAVVEIAHEHNRRIDFLSKPVIEVIPHVLRFGRQFDAVFQGRFDVFSARVDVLSVVAKASPSFRPGLAAFTAKGGKVLRKNRSWSQHYLIR